ncbi:MAG: hypothetical protein GPI90_12420 [Microcystis aeruginosa K13-05]|jgi:hypothetical protein|nr:MULTISPECIES: hypothetical protein [unclassified Microcystis]NCR74816.1 hypothetical protein [Microcystis aeruginosa K13-06]NCR80789.1 hypothetical protein [Microcystis aeruginosa K13-10]NCR85406.1 hypothetical protein [Microcystis aeruginosa K13-05]MCZ8048738.1 hypothetical protein [Microcystis sp. LE19-41.2A]MCZ8287128.1 hypothetical protein [Microcystis sp. LE19-59.1C]
MFDTTKPINQKQIIQIVPFYTNDGDFNVILAEAIRAETGIVSRLINYKSLRNMDDPRVLSSLITPDCLGVLLHYNCRHYDVPHWLLRVLQYLTKTRDFQLIILVHEFSATYTRKGIIFPAFRFLLTSYQILRLADSIVTTTSRIENIVSRLTGKTEVICLPNFSTMGEPQCIPPLKERPPYLIVFGSQHTRPLVYTKFSKNLLKACRALGIERIYDVGYPCDLSTTEGQFKGIEIVPMGFQSNQVVSELMLTSRGGFLDYSRFPRDLGKSTVFAAYAAHGLVPVLTDYNPSEADGVENNKHYLVADENLSSLDLTQLQQIADNAHRWYQDHNLIKVAKFYGSYFNPDVKPDFGN